MAIVFGVTNSGSNARSAVDELFDRDTIVLDETEVEAKVPAGHVAVIRNYRGYTAKSPGRKNVNLGQNMLNFNALGVVPLTDLPRLVERLKALQSELETALS